MIRSLASKRTAAIWADRMPKGFPSDLAKVSRRKLHALAAATTLEDLRQPPYRAAVDFDKVYLAPVTRAELKREAFVAHLVFVVTEQVDNARIPINPLGLTITYFREDQAFVNAQ